MMRRVFLALLATLLAAGIAAAQTGSGTTTTDPNKGAFDKLSPGNQKIARALYEAQRNSDVPPKEHLSLDDIAAMKLGGKGWGNVFKTLKKQELVTEKNLGQVVSRYQHQQRGVTTGGPGGTGGSGSGKAGTTSGGSASSTSTATRGRGQGAYKSTGSGITTGSNQTTTDGHGQVSHGPDDPGGQGQRGGAGAGPAGSQGAGHGSGAATRSGNPHGAGGPSGGGVGHGKR